MEANLLISECIRCGTCCKKGGPSFHSQDKILIEKGIILLKYLFTIRKGEPACDNVKGNLFFVPSDIIKIKSRTNSRSCIFSTQKNAAAKFMNTGLRNAGH